MKVNKLQPLLTGICLACSSGIVWTADNDPLMKSALETVRGASFYGHSGTSIGNLFNNYHRCIHPQWEEHSAELGSNVTFSCEFPCSFKEKLPQGLQAKLSGPAFTRQLRANFGVSQNRSAISLEYLGLGYDYIFPWHQSTAEHPIGQSNQQLLEALNNQDDFALSFADLISPDSEGHIKLRNAAREALLEYTSSLIPDLSKGSRQWLYEKERGCFNYLTVESFTWDAPAPDAAALSGNAVVSLTQTDLTADKIAEHLKAQGIDPYLQDLAELLNAGAGEISNVPYQKSASKKFIYSGSRTFNEILEVLTATGTPADTDTGALLNFTPPANSPALKLALSWDPAAAAAVLKLPPAPAAPYSPPHEIARHSTLSGHPELTADALFSGLKDCANPRWESATGGESVIFSCELPLRGLSNLPEELAKMLQGPEFNSVLKAQFQTNAERREASLKALTICRPGGETEPAESALSLDDLLSGINFVPEPLDLLPVALAAPGDAGKTLARAAAACATLPGSFMPTTEKLWFYPEPGGFFHYLEPQRITWELTDTQSAALKGSASVSLTRTNLTADKLAEHLRAQGIDPYLQDLLALLNVGAPEVHTALFTTEAAQPLEYQGTLDTAAFLHQLFNPGSPVSGNLAVFKAPEGAPAGEFILSADHSGKLVLSNPASSPYSSVAELVRHSELEGYPGKTIAEIFDNYPYAEKGRWELSEDGKTVSFSCEIPFRFKEKLPAELTEQFHGPAFSQILKAQFAAPAATGILPLPVLSTGYGDSFKTLSGHEVKDTIRILFFQEELVSSLSALVSSAELPAARLALKELLHSHFAAPGVSLPLEFRRVLEADGRIWFLKSLDSFDWMPLNAEENFEGIVSLTLVDTGLEAGKVSKNPKVREQQAAAAAAPEHARPEKLWRYSCRSTPEFFEERILDLDSQESMPRAFNCVPLDDAPGILEFRVKWGKDQPRPALYLLPQPQNQPQRAPAKAADTAISATSVAPASVAVPAVPAEPAAVAVPPAASEKSV